MKNIRVIARLDIKGDRLIKGVHLEGLRVLGMPNDFSVKYYLDGIDELIYMDSVATLYGRNHLSEMIGQVTRNVFVPITVGGGIRTVDDAANILRSGADKVAVNTAAVINPKIISDISTRFGSQSMVLSIEAKQVDSDWWEVYTDNGRERTGLNVVDWAKQAASMGAGEILLTSIDREGTRNGFDIDLVKVVSSAVSVPVIASGGMGKPSDLVDVVRRGGADAVAMADILHYQRSTVRDIRKVAIQAGITVRSYN